MKIDYMKWTIRMTQEELRRKTYLDKAIDRRITQKAAAKRLGISERQLSASYDDSSRKEWGRIVSAWFHGNLLSMHEIEKRPRQGTVVSTKSVEGSPLPPDYNHPRRTYGKKINGKPTSEIN